MRLTGVDDIIICIDSEKSTETQKVAQPRKKSRRGKELKPRDPSNES